MIRGCLYIVDSELCQHGALSISALIGMNPETHMQQVFTVEAVITYIDETKGWDFNWYRTRHTKISDSLPHWHCQQPGTKATPNYSCCFKTMLTDTTANIMVTFFSPAAESFLPKCAELLSYTPDADLYV